MHTDPRPAVPVRVGELLLRLTELRGELLPVSKVLGARVWAPPVLTVADPKRPAWWRRCRHGGSDESTRGRALGGGLAS